MSPSAPTPLVPATSIQPNLPRWGGALATYSCDLCQTDFKNKLNLKRHKENIHTSLQEMRAFGIKQKKVNNMIIDLILICNVH